MEGADDIRLELPLPRADRDTEEESHDEGDEEDATDDEEESVEEEESDALTPQAWIVHAREDFEHRLDEPDLFPMFRTPDLLCMVVYPELRTRFVGHLIEREITGVYFEFDALAAYVDWLDEGGLVTTEQIERCTDELGHALQDILKISYLNIGKGAASFLPVAPWLVAACRQVQQLVLGFKSQDDDHSEDIPWSLQGHAATHLRLCNATAMQLRPLYPAIHSMRYIRQFWLIGCEPQESDDYHPLVITEPGDATLLQGVLSICTLEELVLHQFICDDVGAAAILCNGVAASKLTSIKMTSSYFPEGTEEMLAEALAIAPLETLQYGGGSNIYKVLCRELKHSNKIKSLTLGEHHESIGSDELEDILRDGLPPNLECLTLFIDNWTPGFEKLISGFASSEKDGTRLRKLVLHFAYDFDGPATASKAFVAAVDKGARCLEEVLVYRFIEVDITDTWCTDELQSILALNRQRRLHGSAFESIEQGATLATRQTLLKAALERIDKITFYGFLRRNEWRLQSLVRELAADFPGQSGRRRRHYLSSVGRRKRSKMK